MHKFKVKHHLAWGVGVGYICKHSDSSGTKKRWRHRRILTLEFLLLVHPSVLPVVHL